MRPSWRGRPTIVGNTPLGASSPANPHLMEPVPLSMTTACVPERGGGEQRGDGLWQRQRKQWGGVKCDFGEQLSWGGWERSPKGAPEGSAPLRARGIRLHCGFVSHLHVLVQHGHGRC